MHKSVKGLLLICLIFGQLIAVSAQDITCPAPFEDPCEPWNWENQAQWAGLCSRYSACGWGMQSPIDIPVASLECGDSCVRPTISYNTQTSVGMVNIEQTLAVIPDAGNMIMMDNVQYDLQWIEFRQPSEHSLGGDFADFEAQFWHQSADGQWVAIAVLYDIDDDEENVFFATFWDELPQYSNCGCGNGRIEPGEACDDGMENSDTAPDHCRTTCQLPVCGDGVRDRTEECDSGANNNDTRPSTSTVESQKQCRTDCRTSRCGDFVVDAGEECDDGNIFGGDGCSAFCESECGNGRVDGGEECDEGTAGNNDREVDGCRPGCVRAFCGDGVRDTNEDCDNGAANSDTVRNACRTNCIEAFCGDGVIDAGEQCDPASDVNCDSQCQRITPLCGNGNIDGGESCDAGGANSDSSARCRTDCTLPFCGDGIIDRGTLSNGLDGDPITYDETCDFGNEVFPATCNPATCQNDCGNGILDGNEQCDLGGGTGEPDHGNKPNQCRKGCMLPFCGDGVVDEGEECDEGMTGNGSNLTSCDTQCRWKFCGDGILDDQVNDRTRETCDDGNLNDNDGCSSVCQLECGDGVVTGAEECDRGDENADMPDMCKLDCRVPVCGDGFVDFDEECDNINPLLTHTCRSNCKLPFCGDGIIDEFMGEECDNGFDGNNDLQFGGCSTRCTLNDCGFATSNNFGDLNRAMACAGCFYSYMGSATRPPCMGGVHWLVAQSIQKVSQWQIDQFQYIWGENNRRNQMGTCELEDKYNMRMCMCDSTNGGISTMGRMSCSAVPRKPALTYAFDMLQGGSLGADAQNYYIHSLISLIVREPMILPTYYGMGDLRSSVIACETEAFYWRAYWDLSDAIDVLKGVTPAADSVSSSVLTGVMFFEHTLQFLESLQVMTADRSPEDTLTDALASMIGSGAQSPFLPYDPMDQHAMKSMFHANIPSDAPLLSQSSTTGLQARLLRSPVAFNTDPEIHRYSNIPGETVWQVRFLAVEYLKQYGFRNNDGTVQFVLSDEKVIFESNLLNLWNYNAQM